MESKDKTPTGLPINHVYPLNDLREHSFEVKYYDGVPIPVSQCDCVPRHELDPDTLGWLIVHGAFDGREALEEAMEILKQDTNAK